MTRRQRNARRRLAYHAERARLASSGRPMAWGDSDCALFQAAIHVAALGGADPAAMFRRRYATRRGAHRVLGAGGLPLAMRRIARRFGWRTVAPARARIGDLGLVAADGAFGLVRQLHRGQWLGRNDGGWTIVPTQRVRLAWSVV